jgi:hypothetical protein
LIRDRGPIHSLGHGVTSRDIPFNEGETEGISQDSGAVSRALDGHPVMRFFAHTGASLLVAGVMSTMLRKGGLKLAQKIQSSNSEFATSAVKTITDIRRHLDELQGVKRAIDGVNDPYEKLVFDGGEEGLTTGYRGVNSEMHRYSYLTKEEMQQAGRGLGKEPAAVWTMRDEIQKRMVRAGRRMPYELPALYVTQRGLTDTLFGENDRKKKVNWYNPVDVISDFVKTSTINLATIILPFEGLGASMTKGKSSLVNFRNSMGSIRNMSPIKQKAMKGYVDLSELLGEVGHDFTTISNRFLRSSSQLSGAFSAATNAFEEQPRISQSLHDARRGARIAYEKEAVRQSSSLRKAVAYAKSLVFGLDGSLTPGLENAPKYGLLDTIPSFRGITGAFKTGYKEFKLIGQGYDALESAIKYNQLTTTGGIVDVAKKQNIDRAIQKIQSQYNSRISKLSRTIDILGKGGPEDKSFTKSDFYHGQMVKEYKDLLARKLQSTGISEKEANNFINQLNIHLPGKIMDKTTNPANVLTIGRTQIFDKGDDYFTAILERFKTIKGGKTFEQSIVAAAGPKSPSEFLRNIVEDTNSIFLSREFKTTVENKIKNQWNDFYRNDLVDIASSILRPQKATYQEFVGPLTSAKQEFLQRKTAQVLGINLKNQNGKSVSSDIVRNRLAERGFNPNDFTSLRAFLIEKRQMSIGSLNSEYNIFGLKPLLIDEAIQRGKFKGLSQNQQRIISELAGRMAINDPISKSIGFNKLDGVYTAKSGQILDFSAIKNTFGNVANFFASEFQIPIIKLNPADLFGYRSFSDMARKSLIQYSPGRTVQPFGDLASTKSDFHIWHSTGGFLGTKGKVTAFETNLESGAVFGRTLQGTYRPVPTNSTEMLTRHARFASGLDGEDAYQIMGNSGSRFLDKLLGNVQRAIRFKQAMSIDVEQPNSLFGLISRFLNRNRDINNPRVISKLIRGDLVEIRNGSAVKKIRFNDKYELVDEAGAVVAGIDNIPILSAAAQLRKSSFGYAIPDKIMRELEKQYPGIFTFGSLQKRVSDIQTVSQARDFFYELESSLNYYRVLARRMDIDAETISQSFSRIEAIMKDPNLLAISRLAQKSPTITTRLDELKNEIFRFVSQSNALVSGQTDDLFITMQGVIQELKKSIPPSQFAEAQAAALSTLFNIKAFLTYKKDLTPYENARNALSKMLETTLSREPVGESARTFFNPFISGSAATINTSLRKPFSYFLPPFKKFFGTAPYRLNELSSDVLGSGQQMTFVPTFGTVFAKNPIGALKSAAGFTTYSDPGSYSGLSVPISQSVERLNRYFGTLGMQLNVSKFKGPLDLYARGMVGKRVLPIYAAGTTFMTADRMIGGMVGGEDEYGENIYSPYFTTKVGRAIVEAQALGAGLTPGGMTSDEKREQLVEGEVPIRQGRFWPLGNTPFKGGKIQYYRPSWYRKLQAGALFTSDTYGSPAEKFLFYNDISPLRPLDPYRFERKHYEDRPYPVTGEYFTGPFGPITAIANATIGKILKPKKMMHEQEVLAGLSNYVPAGQFGAYNAIAYLDGGSVNAYGGSVSESGGGFRGLGGPGGALSSTIVRSQVGGSNAGYAGAGQFSLAAGTRMSRNQIAGLNQPLMQM